jgi:hypothetical protein
MRRQESQAVDGETRERPMKAEIEAPSENVAKLRVRASPAP